MLRNYADGPRDWRRLLDEAQLVDEVGVDRVVVVDHVVLGPHLDEYPAGTFLTGPGGDWLEPMTTLAALAGVTRRVRLSTAIVIAGLRHPVVFAKTAATLDVLAGGRLDLGVGVGWQRAEYEAVDLPFADRGRILDDALALWRRLWTPGPTRLGPDHREEVWCEPSPVRDSGIPIWIGGGLSTAVLRRIVAHGAGWIPWARWANDVERGIDVIRAALIEGGRSTDDFEVRARLPIISGDDQTIDLDATMERVERLMNAGVTDFSIQTQLSLDDLDRDGERLSALVGAFRSKVGGAAF
ncbi:MAG TPA: TIGR03619 family F420-dependent LLM class oxidoreductase [Nocardioidaceae bacterium]